MDKSGPLTAMWLYVCASIHHRGNQTAHMGNSSDRIIPIHLFPRMEVYGTSESGQKSVDFKTKVYMAFCEPRILRWRNHGSCASCSFCQPLSVHSCGTISTTQYCLMESVYHGIWRFKAFYPRMWGCTDSSWRTRTNVSTTGGKTH